MHNEVLQKGRNGTEERNLQVYQQILYKTELQKQSQLTISVYINPKYTAPIEIEHIVAFQPAECITSMINFKTSSAALSNECPVLLSRDFPYCDFILLIRGW